MKLTCRHLPKEWDAIKKLEEILHPLLSFFLIKLPRFVRHLLLGPPEIQIPTTEFNAELMQFTFPRVTLLVVNLLFIWELRWHKPEEPHGDYALAEKLPIICPRVTTLDLLGSFGRFHETFQFICSFPELGTLIIEFWTCHDIKNVGCFRLPAWQRSGTS